MRRIIPILVLCAVISLCAAGVSQAEEAQPYSRVSLFFIHNGWTEDQPTGEVKVNESVLGLGVNQIVNPQFEFELAGQYAGASFKDPTTDVSLSSITDTRFRGTYYFSNHQASASLILNLPTGKKALTDEEFLVTVGLADNARKYVVRRFGQGFDFGGEAYWLPQYDKVSFNLGGGYLNKGSYQVLASDDAEYKYGSEFHVGGGVHVDAKPVAAHLNASYRLYTDDEFDGQAVYKSGPMTMVDGRITYADRFWVSSGLTLVSRGNADVLQDGSTSLSEESLKSGRNELLFDISTTIPVGERLRALARTEFKNVSANDYDSTSTFFRPKAGYVGLGAGVGYQFTLSLWGSIVGSYYSGSVNEDNDLSGLGVTAALIFRYW